MCNTILVNEGCYHIQYMKYLIPSLLVSLPFVTSAQGLQQYIPGLLGFFNTVLIPFLLGVAFLIVVYNVVKYFIVESTNEDGRAKAKAYILYSVLAFVLILIFLGIVNVLVNSSGLDGCNAATPDYFQQIDGFAVPDCTNFNPDTIIDPPTGPGGPPVV